MSGCYLHVRLILFAVFARELLGWIVETGLYNRVELTGEKLHEDVVDVLESVEWTKQNRSKTCLCMKYDKHNGTKHYSSCCRQACFYSHNYSLILESVTAQDKGVYRLTVVSGHGTFKKSQIYNFTLHILYSSNVSDIVASNKSVTLRCEVNGSFELIKWKRDGVSILEDYKHSFRERNQTLHISNLNESECGTYSCLVTYPYGESEKQIYINGENLTLCQNYHKTQSGISTGLPIFISVLVLCIIFCCIYKYHHNHCHKETPDRKKRGHEEENYRTAEEVNEDNEHVIYQEVPDTEEVTPLPYVYTDFIKPRQPAQDSAPAEDFGYSVVGLAVGEETVNSDCINSDEQTVS